eukprot:116273_1
MSADQRKIQNNRDILPIKEEDTKHSEVSHASSSRKGASHPKSQTYSKADRVDLAGASIRSYSDIYESATRESIDETTNENIKNRIKSSKSKPKRKSKQKSQSITWTHKYTSEMLDKSQHPQLCWGNLVNLEQLYSLQMINTIEYKMRKSKLIDSLTGTKVNIQTETQRSQIIDECKNPPQKRVLGETEIIKKMVNFNELPSERAFRHQCRIHIVHNKDNIETKEEWYQDTRRIKMAKNPFNNGTLRLVYYMQDIDELKNRKLNEMSNELPIKNTATHVAKISIDPMEECITYFHDVAMQKHAHRFADEFNKNEVPKKVGFLDCSVYELVDRTPHVFCGVEQFIFGDYHKYTNNWDWVNQSVDRNTPSAFSHFTYQASGHKVLICDLQGVGDLYTDPQMHTYDGKGCGKGNMGKRGIDKFLSSHKCNAICTYLKLPHTNLSSQFTGTLPQKRYMNNEHIDQIPVTNGEYTIPTTTVSKYGATQTTIHQQLLPQRNYHDSDSDDAYDDDDDNGAYPFGKRLPDQEDNKCWCNLL